MGLVSAGVGRGEEGGGRGEAVEGIEVGGLYGCV